MKTAALQLLGRQTTAKFYNLRRMSIAGNFHRTKVESSALIATNRFFSGTITEASWAATELQKMGVQLSPVPLAEAEVLAEDFLERPPEKIVKLADDVLALNVVEMAQLQRRIQRRMGISRALAEQAYVHSLAASNMVFSGLTPSGGAAAAGPDAGAPAAAAEPVKEKEAFDLKLKLVDAKVKIKVIKEIRVITGLGLKEAKDLVEKAPVLVKPGLKKEEAEAFKKLLVDAGAEVELV